MLPPHKTYPAHPRYCIHERGFSLIEIMTVLGVVGVMATVAVIAAGQITNVAHGEKLRSDVSAVNSAIEVYLSSGGSLDGVTSAPDLLAKLKTSQSKEEAKRHSGGPTGRMIDPRIVAVPFSDNSSRHRAIYNAAERRFSITNSGTGVIFEIDPTLSEAPVVTESRSHGAMAYSESSSWIWDYSASINPDADFGATLIPLSSEPADSAPPSDEEEEEESEPTIDPLPDPVFSPPGGTFSYGDFPFPVTIGGAPAPSDGKIVYRIGTGPWEDYDGETITAAIDLEVRARAVSLNPTVYSDSDEVLAIYQIPTPPRLPTPKLSVTGDAYPAESFPITVAFTNLPDPAVGTAVFRLGTDSWTPYTGPITVPKNTTLLTNYLTSNLYVYQDSLQRSDHYYPIATDLSGNITTSFQNPTGGPTLVYEISPDGTFFSHGDPSLDLGGEVVDAGDANTLRFEPAAITGVDAGESFKLGDLFYHNGTTFKDSHAESVQMQMTITLDDPAAVLAFSLDFDLVNTGNTEDETASADYAKITNVTQNVNLNIDGVDYNLELNFGGTDSFGYSTNSEFHVYEDATGQGAINATLVPVPGS